MEGQRKEGGKVELAWQITAWGWDGAKLKPGLPAYLGSHEVEQWQADGIEIKTLVWILIA